MDKDTLLGYGVATVLAFVIATIAAFPHMQDNRPTRAVNKIKGLSVITDKDGKVIDFVD